MSNHTINPWRKYCLHHKNAIEDLRKRAISNAEKKTISKGMTDATGTEVTRATLPVPQQVDPQQPASKQPAIPQPAIPQQPILQSTISQRVTPQPVAPQQQTPQSTIPPQPTPQLVVPQQATTAHESQQPSPHEKVPKPGPVPVKTEPLDEDNLDFAFATGVLSGWNPNEESDAALWKRMETTVCSLVFSLRLRATNAFSAAQRYRAIMGGIL